MITSEATTLNVCIFGVGGVGGYFGGRLAHWLSMQQQPTARVHFIARGSHLAAISRSGLVLNTPDAQLVCRPASASADITEIPTPDVVLLCVKGYGLDDALKQIASNSGPQTIIIPLLNGIDICDRVRDVLPDARVLPACVFVGTHLEGPGVVTQAGGDDVIFLGHDPAHPVSEPTSFLSLLEQAGINHRWFDDPFPAIWEKFLFISAFGLVTAASRETLDGVLGDDALLDEVRGIMQEVASLASRKGITLQPSAIDDAIEKAGGFPHGTKTSFQRDVESGGQDEGDIFAGAIIRLGREHDMPTPVTERVFMRVRGTE